MSLVVVISVASLACAVHKPFNTITAKEAEGAFNSVLGSQGDYSPCYRDCG